ncbi:MAG: class I adenylate-forming enzyme family protein [Enterocloster bolteae]
MGKLLAGLLRERIKEAGAGGRNIHVYEGMADSISCLWPYRCQMARVKQQWWMTKDKRLTYGRLLDMTDRMAASLKKKQAYKKGSEIGILLHNGPEFCVSYLAANKIGGVAVPLPGKFQRPEILSLLEKADVTTIICEEKFEPWFENLEHVTVIVSKSGPDFGLDWMLRDLEDNEITDGVGTWDDSAILMFTSGTTSRSKGVAMKNYQVMNSVEAYAATLRLTQLDSSVIATPMYHVTGMICILSVMLAGVGGTVYLMKKVDADRILTCFLENNITFYHASPTVFTILLEKRSSYPLIPSVKSFACGSGNMAPENIRKLKEWMPQAEFHTVYGMTETSGAGTIFPGGAADSPWIGASGIPMPDLRIKIADDDGTELMENQIGEICLKGSFVVEEYYKQKADSITEDGWLRTGDLGYYNQAGYLYIVDRKKDMINRGGEKVCSFDIENTIHTLPGVVEAVVVGVPDSKYMEVPAAVIKLEKGTNVQAEDIKEMLKTRVARFKIPEYIVFVEDIPKTHNGKIDKRMIKEWMRNIMEGSPEISGVK